jgi:glyoxylase-like metal-dependent hydrolase (beta-lactamase superfamily II)
VAGLSITTIATPGHTEDSVCFLVEAGGEQVIFTGDTILGRGTTVIAGDDGDLGHYLNSLEVLTAYAGMPALPGHGPALADCGAAATFYLAHRRARLDQVREALAAGAKTAQDVVAKVYADVDRSLWPAAEWTVRAQLRYISESRESGGMPSGLDRP